MSIGIFNDGKSLRRVIMTLPKEEYFKVGDLKAHNIKEQVEVEKTKKQHRILRDTMRKTSIEIIEVSELHEHPNSVFTMDTTLSLGDAFIHLRMGLPTRRGEDEWMASILEDMGLENIGKIKAPGTAEGGDLIPAYPVFFIGVSGRTNLEGAKQLANIIKKFGYDPRIVPVPKKHLHLGGAMTLIGEDRVLACKSIPNVYLRGFEVIRLRCSSFITGNVIYLGEEKIITERRNKEAIEKLESAGYKVYPLDLSEFVKGSGGPSCLILPLERG